MEDKEYSQSPVTGENRPDASGETKPDLASYYASAAAAASSGYEFHPEDTGNGAAAAAPASADLPDTPDAEQFSESDMTDTSAAAACSAGEALPENVEEPAEDAAPASADLPDTPDAGQLSESDMTDVSDSENVSTPEENPEPTENSDPLSDVTDDGSPHGPLEIFSETTETTEETEKKEDDSAAEEPAPPYENAPSFAAFQAPEKNEEENDEDDEPEGAEDDVPMTIMGHLNELRRRLFRIVIIVILGFVAFYGVSEPLYAFLSAPLQACMPEGSKLIYTSPQGAFFTYMKVALVASLFGTSPFSFYQLWAFIAPGLYREERRAVLPLAFFSSVFFLAGASFCFLLVFPIAFQFFMGFASDTIVPMISVEEYLSFALKLLIAFGVVFEMPLFAYFLSRFGLLTPEFMRRSRRYAILVIFIVAAILTPPDVFSQCLMAIPMLLLYEVSIYVSAMAYKKKDSGKEEAEPSEEEKA